MLNIKKVSDIVLFPKNPIPQPGWKKKQPVRCKKRPSQVVTVQSEFLCFSRAAGVYRHICSSHIGSEMISLENHCNEKTAPEGKNIPRI